MKNQNHHARSVFVSLVKYIVVHKTTKTDGKTAWVKPREKHQKLFIS